jgi:hypothetical protein
MKLYPVIAMAEAMCRARSDGYTLRAGWDKPFSQR